MLQSRVDTTLAAPLPPGMNLAHFFGPDVLERRERPKRKQASLPRKAKEKPPETFASRTFEKAKAAGDIAAEGEERAALAQAVKPYRPLHGYKAVRSFARVVRSRERTERGIRTEAQSLPLRREALYEKLEQGVILVDEGLNAAYFDVSSSIVLSANRADCKRMKRLEMMLASFEPAIQAECYQVFASCPVHNPFLQLAALVGLR